jgi:hypothetical protein
LRTVARLLTVAAGAACVLAVVLAPSALRLAATLASIGVLALAFRPGRASAPRQLAVDASGTVRIRAGDSEQAAAVRYVGRHLVCLTTPGGLLAVWPDSMPSADWRRLLVACRWQRRQPGDGTEPPSGLRTK